MQGEAREARGQFGAVADDPQGRDTAVEDLLAPPDPGSVAAFRAVPSDDTAFDAAIRDAASRCLEPRQADLLACMIERLRVHYPNCALRPQAELAAFPGTPPLIYVYRDG